MSHSAIVKVTTPNYRVYIPTLGRVGEQRTADRLTDGIPFTLVCPPEEGSAHRIFYPVAACPVKGISNTRQWIMEECSEDVCFMVDDDLDFQIRINRDDMTAWQLRGASASEIRALFGEMAGLAQTYPMVGLSPRPGNNRYDKTRIVMNQRIFSIYAINTKMFKEAELDFRNMPLMEDFYIALSFLTRGYRIPMVADHTWCQKESNASGGCSTYRSAVMQKDAAFKLQSYFPDFVKVKEKATKQGWFGGTRYDVTIQWKRAYQSGLSARFL